MRRGALWLLALWLIVHAASAAKLVRGADWPQFQGPRGDGSSPETGLLRQWPADGPPIAWRQPIKHGWGSPTVVGDDVYLGWTETPRGDRESIVCLSATDGRPRWQHTYEVGPYWERNIGWARGGFRSTPCVDGERVFALGAIGHLHCLNRKTGEPIWSTNLWDQWNPSGEKGYVFSPIVAEGKLILWYGDGVSPSAEPMPDPELEMDQFEVLCRALDVNTGRQAWEFREPHRPTSRRGEGQTPALADFGGEPCLVVSANAELKALRVRDGRQVWSFPCPEPKTRGTTTPTPLVLDRRIFNLPDADAAQLVEVDREHPDQPTREIWSRHLQVYTPVHQFRHHDGFLYGFSGEIQGGDEQVASDSRLALTCVELATGEVRWSEPGFRAGVALTLADGLLFVRSYQSLRLVEASPAGYRPLGEVKTHAEFRPTLNLLDFVQPVLSQGKLYVRTPGELIRYDVAESR